MFLSDLFVIQNGNQCIHFTIVAVKGFSIFDADYFDSYGFPLHSGKVLYNFF